MDSLQRESTTEEHQFVITDIFFRPNSTQLRTILYDNSLQLWNAAKPTYRLIVLLCTIHMLYPWISIGQSFEKTDGFGMKALEFDKNS